MGGKLNRKLQTETSTTIYVMILLPRHGFNSPPAERSHVAVAFDTVDKGLIFIEPQSDGEVEVRLGTSCSEANNRQATMTPSPWSFGRSGTKTRC